MLEANGNTPIVKCPDCREVLKIVKRFGSMAELRRMDTQLMEAHVCKGGSDA